MVRHVAVAVPSFFNSRLYGRSVRRMHILIDYCCFVAFDNATQQDLPIVFITVQKPSYSPLEHQEFRFISDHLHVSNLFH